MTSNTRHSPTINARRYHSNGSHHPLPGDRFRRRVTDTAQPDRVMHALKRPLPFNTLSAN